MRIVQKWSYACANHLASSTNENHQRRAVYYYGFYIVIGALVKGTILFSVAAILRILIPTLIVVFVFGSLRMFAGGFHMDTYNKCLIVSMAIYLMGALISKYSYIFWRAGSLTVLFFFTFITGIYVLLRYAPKDTPNKRLTDTKQKKKLRIISIIYFGILLAALAILIYFNIKMYAIALCYGILFELFTLTQTGSKFLDWVKEVLDLKKFINTQV